MAGPEGAGGRRREASLFGVTRGLGMLGDSVAVGLSKITSRDGSKDLDIALVKATNYDEVPPKEKHVATILKSLAEGRGYGDTLYILDGLMRRLNSGKHWVVILKVLTVVHRMLREGPQGTSADILRCVKENGPLWRLANYKDDAPGVADQSAFVRVYAGYLDARLKCVQELGMDVGREPVGGHSATRQMGTRELVEKLPLIQAQMEKATARPARWAPGSSWRNCPSSRLRWRRPRSASPRGWPRGRRPRCTLA